MSLRGGCRFSLVLRGLDHTHQVCKTASINFAWILKKVPLKLTFMDLESRDRTFESGNKASGIKVVV